MEKKEIPDVRFTTPDFTPTGDASPCPDLDKGVVATESETLEPYIPDAEIPDLFPDKPVEVDNEDFTGDDNLYDVIVPVGLVDAEAVMTRLDELMQKFDDRIARDEHKDALFDKMYAELATYKNDIYGKLLKPFILSAISLLDDTNSFIAKLNESGENADPAKMRRFIDNLPLDIEEMLEINGVELYTDDSKVFNPATQRVVKVVECCDMDNDKLIAERHRRGYRWNGVVLRPEMVSIYKYKQKPQS